MKRGTVLAGCWMAICVGLPPRLWSVWVPSTSVEGEPGAAASKAGPARSQIKLEERLQDDERRLAGLLQDIHQDLQELRSRQSTVQATGPQEKKRVNDQQ